MAALAARRRKGGTRFVPPKTAEDAVPVRRIWPDGVCLTDDGEYAKTWRVSDVNYAAASKEDKEAMFLGYSDLLNSFDSDARAKVTVAVRRLDAEALGRRILIPPKGDGLDRYREEYNAMLIEKATGANSMVREIYLTIAVGGRSIQEARSYFNRASAETAAHLARLGAHCEELDAEGKLRLLRGFYRGGADDLPIDVRASMRRTPMGSAVDSPSSCWKRRTERRHRCLRAHESSASVSASSSSGVSAKWTSVTVANIMRWSRDMRSSRNSRLSLRCCSMS